MGHRSTAPGWILLAALVAGQARAQSVAFGPPVAVPPTTPPVQVALAPWTSPPALDLFVAEPRVGASSSAFLYRRGDLAPVPFPWTSSLTAATCFTAGSWVGPGLPATPGDGLADLGWCGSADLRYQFSVSLAVPFAAASLHPIDSVPTGLVFARLLDRADLVLAVGERQQIEIAPGPLDAGFTSHLLYYPAPRIPVPADTFALQPLRLGGVARSSGLHDLAWSRVGRPDLFVLWTLAASSQPTVGTWDGRLLTFAGALEVRGAGAADADGDGIPDLLAVVIPLAGSGRLVAVHNPGSPFSLDPAGAVEVGAALGLAAPAFAAPLDLDGIPAAAVFDAGTTPPRLHVVTANPGGGLRSWWTATNPIWGQATQVLAGDLVGSPAADLVAVFADGTIQVWPGDLPPAIAWAPGSPPAGAGTAAPLVLAVDAADPDGGLGPVELRLQGQPSGIVPAQSGTRYTFTVPAATLCALRPSASVAVRATDDLGAWREVAAAVAISGALDLQLDGAGSTRSVPLLPGGTTVTLAAQVADGCGRLVNVAWAEQGLPAGASTSTVFAAGASVRTLVIPEAAYPAMVAGPSMSVPVAVTASAGGDLASAQIALAFDASGLVAAEHRSDRTALGPGELALLTTTLRSRIGVPLPEVALDDRLSGLVPAGPARVSGARLLASVDGTEGLSVTLDEIPGGGAPVVVELPVRRAEGAGGSSRAQAVAAATGVALSPAAEAAAPGATAAGIACGSGGGSPLWLLGLFLYMKAMRRVPARTRSTSSRTPMSRQA